MRVSSGDLQGRAEPFLCPHSRRLPCAPCRGWRVDEVTSSISNLGMGGGAGRTMEGVGLGELIVNVGGPPRTGPQLLHCREAGGPALGPGGLLAGALGKGEEEREEGLERRGGSQLQETTPYVGGGAGSPQAALRVRGASPTSPSSLPSCSAVLGPLFPVGVNHGPSVGRWHGSWWGAKTQVPPFPWPAHLDDPALLSPAVDPSPWVGGPQRPPGQRNPTAFPGPPPPGPSHPPPSLAPTCRGLQLPLGRPTSTWAQAFIAKICGWPGWQIFGDCIVIADWANRARLL